MYYDPTSETGDTASLICGITLPFNCRVTDVSWRVELQNHLGNNDYLFIKAGFLKSSGVVIGSVAHNYASGGIYSAGGTGYVAAYSSGTHAFQPDIDITYFAYLGFYASGGLPNTAVGTLIHVTQLYVKTEITEASHVY
jgi:hypothetical protein